MRLVPLAASLALPLLAWLSDPASAMMDVLGRTPTKASIPCDGVLSEVLSGGAIGTNVSEDLTLTCISKVKVEWILRASVNCGSADQDMPASFCEGPSARPVYEFGGPSFRSPTDTYRLYRYVFAKDCVSYDVRKRRLEPVTNKVVADFVQPGLACREVGVVNGAGGDARTDGHPGTWKSVTVTTTGPAIATVDTPVGEPILGVDDGDFDFSLTWTKP